MYEACIEYSIDGYNCKVIKAESLPQQLQMIKEQTRGISASPFGVDIVIENIGRMSIALADKTVLCYKSADLDVQLTALGDLHAEGNTSFYFDDLTLMSNKYLIAYEPALDAVIHWINTAELSDRISWTDVLY